MDHQITSDFGDTKTLHFKAIDDVKIIECRLHSWTKTAKKNKREFKNSNNNKFGDCSS